jgi:hypothetical protein
MSSSTSSDLDLDKGLPTTEADVQALARLPPARLSTEEYLILLRFFEPKDTSTLRDHVGPGGVIFEL